jgi:hypothetical protein
MMIFVHFKFEIFKRRLKLVLVKNNVRTLGLQKELVELLSFYLFLKRKKTKTITSFGQKMYWTFKGTDIFDLRFSPSNNPL